LIQAEAFLLIKNEAWKSGKTELLENYVESKYVSWAKVRSSLVGSDLSTLK